MVPAGLFENLGRDLAIAAFVIFLVGAVVGFGIGYWF